LASALQGEWQNNKNALVQFMWQVRGSWYGASQCLCAEEWLALPIVR
jgi:hypothetical protein